MHYLYIAVGGAIGAARRYLISGWAYALLGTGFPWGTLAVNLIGSFLIGFLWQLFANTAVSPNIRLLILTGGLGAFTTFSTFALESIHRCPFWTKSSKTAWSPWKKYAFCTTMPGATSGDTAVIPAYNLGLSLFSCQLSD